MTHLSERTAVELEDEIATLAGRIAAATGRLLELLGELDRRGAFGEGFLSLAHWLSWRTGLRLSAAREHVRVARALRALPETSAALNAGDISYSKARAITRVARPDTEQQLLDMAQDGSTAQLERIVRGVRVVGLAESERAQRIESRRHVDWSFDDDGMLVLRARLAPEEGALLLRALEAARRDGACEDRAAALACVADRALSGENRTGGERTQIVVHVDAAVLADPQSEGRCQLADGPCVSAEASRRLACDASIVVMRHGKHEGELLDVGRKTRVVPAPLRRALLDRDAGHCVFPGCSNRIVDAHHLVHWADGGATSLENTALICRSHHTLVHEAGYRMVNDAGGGHIFYRPDGRRFEYAPQPPPAPALPRLEQEDQTSWTLAPTWCDGDDFDYDSAVESLL